MTSELMCLHFGESLLSAAQQVYPFMNKGVSLLFGTVKVAAYPFARQDAGFLF